MNNKAKKTNVNSKNIEHQSMNFLNELRVGNYIIYDNLHILEFTEDMKYRLEEEIAGKKCQTFNSSKMRPLPISPLALKKFGFIPDIADVTWSIKSANDSPILLMKEPDQWSFIIRRANHFVYVHQLQNVYEEYSGKKLEASFDWDDDVEDYEEKPKPHVEIKKKGFDFSKVSSARKWTKYEKW